MMDLSFWLSREFNICTSHSLVSILVMMDLSFWQVHVMRPIFHMMVSMLVMMDLSFWQEEHNALCTSRLSFNPCYDGFVFLTVHHACDDVWYDVSILVMMDLSFWHEILATLSKSEPFQSLLWWICLFDASVGVIGEPS